MKKSLEVKVRAVITLAVTAVFTVLALIGEISPDNVLLITGTVIAFYFGTEKSKGT